MSSPGRAAPRVRLAAPGDLDGVLALYAELRPDDPVMPREEAVAVFGRILAEPKLALVVCEDENRLAATCMLAIIGNLGSGGRPFGVIEHVVTRAERRRRGLARATLLYALDLAWARQCCKVMLLSGGQRREAHALYESVGFRGDTERAFVARPGVPGRHAR